MATQEVLKKMQAYLDGDFSIHSAPNNKESLTNSEWKQLQAFVKNPEYMQKLPKQSRAKLITVAAKIDKHKKYEKQLRKNNIRRKLKSMSTGEQILIMLGIITSITIILTALKVGTNVIILTTIPTMLLCIIFILILANIKE